MAEITLLSTEDLKGKIFQRLGTKGFPTHFSNSGRSYWTKTLKRYNGGFWSNRGVYLSCASEFYVHYTGELFDNPVICRYGVRPVLIPDNFDEIIKEQQLDSKGIGYVTYGEFPQTKAKKKKKLVTAFNKGEFNKTGKIHITLGPTGGKEQHLEYEYNGKKYIFKDNNWFEVAPIKWIVDENNRRLISKNNLFKAPLNYGNPYYDGRFETSSLYEFLNNQFLNEIIPGNLEPQAIQEETQNNLDEEIFKLQELINEYKKNRVELLTAESEALDSELAALGIDPIKGTAYTIKPQSQNSKVPSGKQ